MLHVPSDHIWRPDIVLYNKYVPKRERERERERDVCIQCFMITVYLSLYVGGYCIICICVSIYLSVCLSVFASSL
ncbi:Acetylcholine receptor subunit alpha-like [Portunus trituberculatus]|uniref:Acetylcholine receptor subunit alpha-like n=1 Tax=Portunus trituberculatus TaxID=210409 RepID=A0A5B7J306_PORTR|nr:Acetylcholine receptor subunit alpha-like [Portunus trituberculatus]